MTQEQIKEQLIEYANNNMDNKTILESIAELLLYVEADLRQDGYIKESNILLTNYLKIKDLIEYDNI